MSHPSAAYGLYPFPGDVSGDEGGYGGMYAPYIDLSLDLEAVGDAYSQGEVPVWAHDSYREGGYREVGLAPYSDRVPASGYLSDPSFGDGAGYPWYPVERPDTPQVRDLGYSDGVGLQGALPSAPAPGYRFRGDEPGGFRGQGEAPWRYGYRFRPLTEQERQRMDIGTWWRPRSPGPVRERFRRGDPLPAEEAYGYRPDSWFSRYYGVQP